MTFADITRHLQPTGSTGWRFDLPNGQSPSVIPDGLFRFELFAPDVTDRAAFGLAPDGIRRNLTTEQVETLLVQIAALPDREGRP